MIVTAVLKTPGGSMYKVKGQFISKDENGLTLKVSGRHVRTYITNFVGEVMEIKVIKSLKGGELVDKIKYLPNNSSGIIA